jgi:hypothetical protein
MVKKAAELGDIKLGILSSSHLICENKIVDYLSVH